MNNPIIDEIRQASAALAAEHAYDLVRINDWARQQTEAHRKLHFKTIPDRKSRVTTEGPRESFLQAMALVPIGPIVEGDEPR
jgi:hypothetical protein